MKAVVKSNEFAGAACLLLAAGAAWIAFLGLPTFGGYRINALLDTTAGLRPGSPVRIAGVNVGEVTAIAGGPGATARISMRLSSSARPLRAASTLIVRPRLPLEGNDYVDLHPSTTGPEMSDGATIPLAQTAGAVALDEVVDTFDSDTRANLRTTLDEYGRALRHGGALALRATERSAPSALRGLAITSDALRGRRADDLGALVRSQARLARAIASDPEALDTLLPSLDRTLTAVDHQARLTATSAQVASLGAVAPAALTAIRRAAPALTGLAREARPTLRALPAVLDESVPFLRETARLMEPAELPTFARQLRPTARALTRAEPQLTGMLPVLDELARCGDRNILPVLDSAVDDGDLSTGQPIWQEILHAGVGLGSASQTFDGDGHAVRFGAFVGDRTVSTGDAPGAGELVGRLDSPLLGARPPVPSAPPPFVPRAPCVRQPLPDLSAAATPGPALNR